MTDHRIVGGRADGQGHRPRGGEGHRRRRDDDRPRVRGHARPLVRDPPRRARPPELELLRQPRLRRDHRPRPADRHERHVRLSGPGRGGRAGRPAGLLDRPGRLLGHRLPVGRGGRRGGRPVQEVLPHEHAEVVHDRQPPPAPVDDRRLPQARGDAHDRGGHRPEARPDPRHRRLQRQRARLPVVPLAADVVELFARTGISYTPTLLVDLRRPVRRDLLLHHDRHPRRPQDPPVHPPRRCST